MFLVVNPIAVTTIFQEPDPLWQCHSQRTGILDNQCLLWETNIFCSLTILSESIETYIIGEGQQD